MTSITKAINDNFNTKAVKGTAIAASLGAATTAVLTKLFLGVVIPQNLSKAATISLIGTAASSIAMITICRKCNRMTNNIPGDMQMAAFASAVSTLYFSMATISNIASLALRLHPTTAYALGTMFSITSTALLFGNHTTGTVIQKLARSI